MKRLFSLFLVCVALGLASVAKAQSSMVITKTDGTQVSIRLADIQDVTFPSDDRTIVELSYKSFWLKPEQWIRVEAECTNAEGEYVAARITWQSTDESVAKVDKSGIVTAIGDGSCQILAITDDGQGAMTVNVTSQTLLDIEVGAIENLTCNYKVTPADASLRYYTLLRIQSGDYSVDGMVQYGSEEQNVFHFAMDWWQFCADMYGSTWVDFMNERGLSSGTITESEAGLKSGAEYCIFAFAMNEDGTIASPVEVKKFSTPVPEQSDITFSVSVDEINSQEVIFTVEPSNNDKYFVNVQRASYVDWFIDNDCLDTEMVQSLTGNISPQQYPEAYCQGKVTRSTDDFLASIRKDTDYYIIVFGFDNGPTSKVSLTKFHTLP